MHFSRSPQRSGSPLVTSQNYIDLPPCPNRYARHFRNNYIDCHRRPPPPPPWRNPSRRHPPRCSLRPYPPLGTAYSRPRVRSPAPPSSLPSWPPPPCNAGISEGARLVGRFTRRSLINSYTAENC
ncbi:hypothetical protein BRADI_1g41996v3 [Brachypodium distachyon]|uniref:Uncharacterized protein n=1 Tax=Brachypodium distachyon TaxID=15368 RepID=A0A0Q3H647_BRADI|nr:hypothetical protein BRADI_1g41996v3 [Brachypodium distachyon]